MKKNIAIILTLSIGLVLSAPAHAASGFADDNVVDKAGDWLATLGKDGAEKDQILMQRRTERISKRMQKAVKKESKAAGKEMKKLGKEMEKAFK